MIDNIWSAHMNLDELMCRCDAKTTQNAISLFKQRHNSFGWRLGPIKRHTIFIFNI